MLNVSFCVSNSRSFQMIPWAGTTPKAYLASVHIFKLLVKAVISASWVEVPTRKGLASVTLSVAVTVYPALLFPCLHKTPSIDECRNPQHRPAVPPVGLTSWHRQSPCKSHCWLGGSSALLFWVFSKLLPSLWSVVLSVEKLDSHLNQEIQQTHSPLYTVLLCYCGIHILQ